MRNLNQTGASPPGTGIANHAGSSTASGFEEIDHTADVAFRLWAPDYESLLVQAAWAAAQVMSGDIYRGPFQLQKQLVLEAFDRESLLVEWLSELTYFAEADREVFYEFEFERVSDRRLIAVAGGKRVKTLKTVIKAITYHNLKIVKTDRGLETTIVFDV